MTALLHNPRGLEISTVVLEDAQVTALRSTSLGNWSYMISSGGDAVVVDATRDIEIYLTLAAARGERIRHVLETHVHSDYLSGGRALAAETGADVVASALGKYEFPHRAVEEGEDLEVGALDLSCVATPGHTFDHISWRITVQRDRAAAGAVLTGGSLLPGGAGRTDLAYPAATERLTALQFESIHRLGRLPDSTLILPTHGGGSACSVGDQEPITEFRTVAQERAANPFLAASTLAEFDARLTSGRGPAPAYFPHVCRLNRQGVPGNGRPGTPEFLGAGDFGRRIGFGLAIVDTRDRWSFADAHIPGALNIEAFDTFASNLGSTVPFGTRIGLVIDDRDRPLLPDLVAAAYRIGYRVDAVLEGGIDGWREAGFFVTSYPATDVLELIEEANAGARPAILDVRDPHEWADGTIPGSVTIALKGLAHRAHELRDELQPRGESARLTVACLGGARAAVAASYLSRLGIPVRAILGGGIPDALAAMPSNV